MYRFVADANLSLSTKKKDVLCYWTRLGLLVWMFRFGISQYYLDELINFLNISPFHILFHNFVLKGYVDYHLTKPNIILVTF